MDVEAGALELFETDEVIMDDGIFEVDEEVGEGTVKYEVPVVVALSFTPWPLSQQVEFSAPQHQVPSSHEVTRGFRTSCVRLISLTRELGVIRTEVRHNG